MTRDRLDLRLLGAFVALLLAAGARVWWEHRHSSSNEELEGRDQPLFPDLEISAVDRLAILDPRGSSVRLFRDGEHWRIEDSEDLRADAFRVQRALDALANATRGRMTTGATEKVRFGLDDAQSVRVTANAGETAVVDLHIGTTDLTRSFVFLADEGVVRQIPGDLRSAFVQDEPGARGWRDRTVFDLDPLSVTQIVIERGDERCVLAREGDSRWQMQEPQEGPALAWRAEGLAETMSRLQAERFLAAETDWGLDPPAARVRARFSDGEETVLLVADRTTDGLVPVRRPDRETVVGVPYSKVEPLLRPFADLRDR